MFKFLIHSARTEQDFEEAKQLFQKYYELTEQQGQNICFANFQEELNSLNERYIPPKGLLLLAHFDSEKEKKSIACIALSRKTSELCEMKRLFVFPSYRKHGIGKSLIISLMEEAKNLGFQEMVLELLPSFQSALSLYKKLGFHSFPNPEKTRTVLKLEKRLDETFLD